MWVFPYFIVVGFGFGDTLIALDQLPPTYIPSGPPPIYQPCDTREPAPGMLPGAALCDPPAPSK